MTSLGAVTIQSIRAAMDSTTLASTFTNFPESFTALETYFTSYIGTYSSLATTGAAGKNAISVSLADPGKTSISFTPTTLTISVGAVPEPSSFALLAGLTALGFISTRRRRLTPSH